MFVVLWIFIVLYLRDTIKGPHLLALVCLHFFLNRRILREKKVLHIFYMLLYCNQIAMIGEVL